MLTQVFVNLIRNAREAIKEKGLDGDGLISISSEIAAENKLYLKIKDNGMGMAPEVKEKLFRFKFTTKKDGTGVGLHLSKMILKLHEGDIKVESEKGYGSTFLIYLPFQNNEKLPEKIP
jgi:signal transduction histidine kinase